MLISKGFIGNPERAHMIEDLYHDLGADDYAKAIRRPAFSEGYIDIFETAEAVGVDLQLIPNLPYNGHYLPDRYPPRVEVRSGLSIFEQDLTVGHELGHDFLYRACGFACKEKWLGRTVTNYTGPESEQEDFCEYFGLLLILDRSPISNVNQLTL
jgi:hypothetical protein